jgi:hypothetical protein
MPALVSWRFCVSTNWSIRIMDRMKRAMALVIVGRRPPLAIKAVSVGCDQVTGTGFCRHNLPVVGGLEAANEMRLENGFDASEVRRADADRSNHRTAGPVCCVLRALALSRLARHARGGRVLSRAIPSTFAALLPTPYLRLRCARAPQKCEYQRWPARSARDTTFAGTSRTQ